MPVASPAPLNFFANYTQRPARVPVAVWWALRVVVLLTVLALIGGLIWAPTLGLRLFWGLAVPVLPALLVVAPGLWRQVCPMATLNQIPRQAGVSRGRDLPAVAKTWAFSVALVLFVGAVALRAPLLNHDGAALAAVLGAVLVLALAGGWWFKGRSGWCGTFCPLGPIQRDYGQAPLVVVRNGFCEPCLGCQKNCYDFNPRAAVFSDVYDDDPRWAGQRRLFIGLMPGLILGYFLGGAGAQATAAANGLALAAGAAASAGAYALAVAFVPTTPYRISMAFGAVALAVFYAFAGPVIVDTLAWLAGAEPLGVLRDAAQGLGVVLAGALAVGGLRAERHYREAQAARAKKPAAAPTHADETRTQIGGGRALKDRLAGQAGQPEVTDRATGIAFQVAPEQTLLEAIEHAGLKIAYGCRAGVCGADPVAVCDGGEHLSPPDDDELATLQRLGLEGRARLACMCTVRGPVVIDRDPRAGEAPVSVLRRPQVDKAQAAGIGRVVIVGDGVAGMSAAEALRRDSGSLRITLVGNEPVPFYNRMGIGRLVYDDDTAGALQALRLVPDDWATGRDVTVHRGAVAVRLDRENRRVGLNTGEWLRYDRLILATGARSAPPDDRFLTHPNAFVLRSADDAQQIRAWVKQHGSRRALVVGGGVLGVEAADALHHLGLKVTLLQRADRLMNAQLDAPGAARLAHYLESIGIQVGTRMSVARYDGEPLLTHAWLAHGPRVRADLFVACLGIQPNVHLAQAAGLNVNRGIVVDAAMRTSDPLIQAIGDVAELPGQPGGLWPVGAAQAAAAVGALWGDGASYQPPRIVLQLKCDGIDLRSWGDVAPKPGDTVHHARADDLAWWQLILRGGALAGGLWVGPPGSAKAFTKLLQKPEPDALQAFVASSGA
ncbi:FAD-dependent oxidoreductase [Rubrivivax albus]|uniref:2Fe-2S iron-sulfur cluster binding domain-containing protein n=1 Tax=Rubrivivax albus TaxID=2499835 RepID=A0A3S2TJN4_9BURK|nr:FAD-dependent oxidoreductase [Rubrivivax albus]RVT48493.1 2Fe-2S iron-sulfur cluster binding domain-containing protein [Rubrivivax albus]